MTNSGVPLPMIAVQSTTYAGSIVVGDVRLSVFDYKFSGYAMIFTGVYCLALVDPWMWHSDICPEEYYVRIVVPIRLESRRMWFCKNECCIIPSFPRGVYTLQSTLPEAIQPGETRGIALDERYRIRVKKQAVYQEYISRIPTE